MRCIKRRKGFTLVELAVVLAVIAIILAIVVPNFDNIVGNSQNSANISQFNDLYSQYVIDNTKSGTIDEQLYIEVDGKYVLFLDGKAKKLEDGSYFVDKIYVNDDLLQSNGVYLESKFKTHESIKEEFLKDFNKFAKDNGSPKVENFDGFVASPVAGSFLSADTNTEKYEKWEWLFNEIDPVTAEKIKVFFTDPNTIFDDYYQLIPRPLFFGSDYTFETVVIYPINYELTNGNWDNNDTIITEFTEEDEIELATPIREGYRFLGWYDVNDQKYEYTSQLYSYYKEQTEVNENTLKLYDRWETLTYTLDYNIKKIESGGVVTGVKIGDVTITIDDIILELLSDFNAYAGTSYDAEHFYALAYNTEIANISKFFLYANPAPKEKWGWLVDYFKEVSNGVNKNAWKVLYNYTVYDDFNKSAYKNGNTSNAHGSGVGGYSIYSVEVETKGFIGRAVYHPSGLCSANYSDKEIQNKMWYYYLKSLGFNEDVSLGEFSTVYNVETETISLPSVNLSSFAGWYTNPEFSGSPITSISKGSTGNIKLYPKWKGFVGLHKSSIVITNFYDYNNYTDANVTDKIFLCNPNMIPRNSLRFQHKILLQYDPIKNAYLVIAESPAYPNVGINSVALPAGTYWTHAISDSTSSSSLLSYTEVGDYIVLPDNLSVGMGSFVAYVYNSNQYK